MNSVDLQPETLQTTKSVQSTSRASQRKMRRPYKSMSESKLISKKILLQDKLAVLQIRVNTWNVKVEKYDHELLHRTSAGDASVGESSAGDSSAGNASAVNPSAEVDNEVVLV